jgi:hypothetical protein
MLRMCSNWVMFLKGKGKVYPITCYEVTVGCRSIAVLFL